MILVRLLSYLRRHWPRTHIFVRGDSHFATPSVNVGISCNSASSSAVNLGPEVASKSSCMSESPCAPSLGRQFFWKTSLATEIAVIALGQPA
jgi:hypothetical protein